MTTPATPAPRYRNYGELINPATNTAKFWMVEVREQAVWVRHGRITPTMGSTVEERCRTLIANPNAAAVKRVGQLVGAGAMMTAVVRAQDKAKEGYTFLWDPHAGQPDRELTAPPPATTAAAPRRAPEPPPDATTAESPAHWLSQARHWF